jgi:hypothetical protein
VIVQAGADDVAEVIEPSGGGQGLINRKTDTGDDCSGLAKQSGSAVAGGDALEVPLGPNDPIVELVIGAPLAAADEPTDCDRNAGGCQCSRCKAKWFKPPTAATGAVAVLTLLLLLQVPPAFKPT